MAKGVGRVCRHGRLVCACVRVAGWDIKLEFGLWVTSLLSFREGAAAFQQPTAAFELNANQDVGAAGHCAT